MKKAASRLPFLLRPALESLYPAVPPLYPYPAV